jgi:glycosyltransferase involved in cell wall biosynthesis
MRILEIETFGRGGLVHYSYNLARALAERGHEVTLLTTRGYELHDRPIPSGMAVHTPLARFTNGRGRALPGLIIDRARSAEAVLDAVKAAAFARRTRPDLIHFHSTNTSSLLYLMLLRTADIPVVTTAHQVTPHERIRFQDAIYRRIHRLPDAVVAHSEVDRRRLVQEFGLDGGSIVVVPHGEYGFFDGGRDIPEPDQARRHLGLQAHHEVVLFFGHIRDYKGLDLLLECWPVVAAARPNARLVVAGDPGRLSDDRRNELRARADAVGAIHRFEYIPFAEVATYFSASDVVAMPYRKLSQSGVLYLALSQGVAVVASAVGGIPEVLTDGESGLLVPPGSVSALGEALIRVLADEELRSRLAAGGGSVAREHSWPAIAKAIERVFRRLVAGQSVRPAS